MTSIKAFGRVTVLSGPSGVGKGSLVKKLIELHPEIWLSVSATTRKPREGEIDGEHYFFMRDDQFQELLGQNGFIEWAEFAGNRYGTPRAPIQNELNLQRPVLLEIELKGARQVRDSMPDAFQIFLAPPDIEELERRIRGRATESEESIQRRLQRAREELTAQKEFDAVVINEDLMKAVNEIEKLMNLNLI